MYKDTQTKFKFKTLFFLLLTLVFLLGFFVLSPPAKAQELNHLVISAVQITEGEGKTAHDFIEIYNPTDIDINLDEYRLVKRSEIGDKDDLIKAWGNKDIIQSHGWRLWASNKEEGYNYVIKADDSTTDVVSPNNGIAIRRGADNTGEIIDSVAWGVAKNIFKKGLAVSVNFDIKTAQILVRKFGNGLNYEDTGNNASDFFIADNYKPHNSGGYTPIISTPTAIPTLYQVTPSPNISLQNHSNILKSLVAEAGANEEILVGQTIFFDGSDSFDPEGTILEYEWNFGDGLKAKGVNPSHFFNSVGSFKVILKITSGNRVAEDFLTVDVGEPDFSDKIMLSEILPDPIGEDKDGEWIEIFNDGDRKVNLKSWILDDNIEGGSKPYVFAEDVYIEAKKFFIIPRSKSKIVLPNTGGEINLLWFNNQNLSKVIYAKTEEGRSFALFAGAWQWTENTTPGQENYLKNTESNDQPKKTEVVLPKKAEKNMAEISRNVIQKIKPEQIKITNEQLSEKLFNKEALSAENILNNIKVNDDNLSNNLKNINGNDSEYLKHSNYNQTEEKENPWFWGNMALSIISLFLVWRYQNLKNKIKRI